MNLYHDKLNDHIKEIPGRMYTFEITKCCDYSTFIFMYKDETLMDLYNRVSHHFGLGDIKKLFIKIPNYDDDVTVPLTGLKTIRSFINDQICCNPSKMVPIYDLPAPVVYRIYLDDGHHHNDLSNSAASAAFAAFDASAAYTSS